MLFWIIALVLGILFGLFGTNLLLGVATVICVVLCIVILVVSRGKEIGWINSINYLFSIGIFFFAMWITAFISGGIPQSLNDFIHLFIRQ